MQNYLAIGELGIIWVVLREFMKGFPARDPEYWQGFLGMNLGAESIRRLQFGKIVRGWGGLEGGKSVRNRLAFRVFPNSAVLCIPLLPHDWFANWA
jgi:hypothetical protein